MSQKRTCEQPYDKIANAVQTVLDGKCKRVDVVDGVKVYECKNVIRIDLKIKED